MERQEQPKLWSLAEWRAIDSHTFFAVKSYPIQSEKVGEIHKNF